MVWFKRVADGRCSNPMSIGTMLCEFIGEDVMEIAEMDRSQYQIRLTR